MRKKDMKYLCALLLVLLVGALPAHAQSLQPDTETLERAIVLSVDKESIDTTPGTTIPVRTQVLTAQIQTGAEKEKIVHFENDYTQLTAGQVFYIRHITRPSEGKEYYTVADPYRLPILFALLAAFLLLAVSVGGKQGVRGLISLGGSMALIGGVLIPAIIAGYSPVLVAIGTASLIIIAGSYVTHGVNRTTTAAVLGMIATVLITGGIAWLAVHLGHFSGYSSEDITYVHYQFNGTIDLVGLLMGGILVGLLGVLYDSAIGQAVAVEELMRAGSHLSRREIFTRAMRLGREHIGALINTLAIAYVGASLPLLLLFSTSTASVGFIVNTEGFATELVRILVGSIGLILAVPITTLIATYVLHRYGIPVRNPGHVRHTH